MSETFKEFLLVIAVVVTVTLGVAAVVIAALNPLIRASCMAQTVSFEDRRYGFIQGCMVLHNGKWIPLESFRAVEVPDD